MCPPAYMVPKYPSLNRVKVFPEGGGFVNITVPEGGPTATGINPEGGTAKISCRPPPHRLISGTALTTENLSGLPCSRVQTRRVFSYG